MLLTAGHVLKEIWPGRPWYPHSTNSFLPLPCDGCTFPEGESVDSGIVVLNATLPMWKTLTPASFRPFSPDPGYQHLLVGYPWASTKGSTPDSQRIELKGYHTTAAPSEEYERLGADPTCECILSFRKKNVFERNRKLMTFPNPYGMSGGAVFQFPEDAPTSQSLVGIMIRWDPNRKNAVIARRIEAFTKSFSVVRFDESSG